MVKYTFSVIRHRAIPGGQAKTVLPGWVRYYSSVFEGKCILVAIYANGRAAVDTLSHISMLGKDQKCSKRRFENAFQMALRRIQKNFSSI